MIPVTCMLFIAALFGCTVPRDGGQETTAPPANPGANRLFEEAKRLEARGETGKAITAYMQAVNEAPDDPLFLTGLGLAYLRAENPAAARPHLARAVHIDDTNYLSRQGYGYVLLKLGDAERAVKELQAALDLHPSPESKFLLAEAFEKLGERQRAIALYRELTAEKHAGKLGRAAAGRLRELTGK